VRDSSGASIGVGLWRRREAPFRGRHDNIAMSLTVASVNVPRHPEGDTAAGGLRLAPTSGWVDIGLRGFATEAIATPSTLPLEAGTRLRRPGRGAAEESSFAHALYAYPTVHLPFWRTVRAQARVADPDDIPYGAFDEHLSLGGVQESQLWLGDLLRFPDCTLVVSGPRMPDERFNETLGFPHAARMVEQSRWCGFWLAVRAPGRIAAGDTFQVVPGPRVIQLIELFRDRVRGR
jgi:hypothetical protein